MPLTIKPASGSGSATLISVAGTTTNDTLTLPAKTGNIITSADSGTVTQTMLGTNVAGNGPTFSVYSASNQSLSSGTFTKVQLATKEWDTGNLFDNVTNYRFTPNVAGYYFFDATITYTASSGLSRAIVSFYKNGVEAKRANDLSVGTGFNFNGCAMLYLNGTTDYVELYGWVAATSPVINAGSGATFFQGFLARSA